MESSAEQVEEAVEIAAWLRGLGLQQYEQAFRDNDIDASLLPKLTAEDLVGLRITSVGHRRKLLDAIEAIRAATMSIAEPASAATRANDLGSVERRQLTVMFCDLVGSTALSTRIDPEDLRAVIGAYHHCCSEVVECHGGFIAKYMGDGVLAYFGYPRAHEHDAERAVRAGLALVETVGKLDTAAGVPLQVRVGMATGLVVVGDLIGAGAAREQAVVGETPNLAARLQTLAKPGAVVIASSTRRLAGGLFEYGDLGPVALRGFAENVPAWQVLRASAAESRFEAQRGVSLTALVGREEELDLLLDGWRRAKRGEGQVVMLVGEPGIGKSRITQALQEQLQGESHTQLRYFCSPHHQNSALYPFVAQLERAANFGRDDAPETKLAKLEAVLKLVTERPEEIAFITELLSLPTTARYQLPQLSPQKRKERTFEALLAQLAALAALDPLLMLFEDVHWIDPSSLELLSMAVERICRQSVLLIVTTRPEFTAPWLDKAHVAALPLKRLDDREGTELVQKVVGNKALPDEVMNQILSRTDGVPLFMEELTRTVLESGLLREEDAAFVLTGPLPPLAIPTTLQASLLARLDRLAPVREVAQIGAALGRQFSEELIAAVAPMPEPELRGALDQLVAAELMFRRGTRPNAEYIFKHALVQDAAYSTLLKSKRQQLHARIATILERQFPEIGAGQPEMVARHCTEAGLSEAAIDWWRKAGELALRRSAFRSAVAHLDTAIRLADSLADSPAHRLRRMRLQTAYCQALVHSRGQSAPQTIAAFARARELAAGVEDPAERFSAYYGMWTGSFVRADLASMRELAQDFLHDVKCRPGSPEAGIAHRVCGITCWFQGDFVGARAQLEQALAFYDHERDRHLVDRFAWDPGVPAISYLGLVLWPLGEFDRAIELMQQAFKLAVQGGHVPTVVVAHLYMCLFAVIRRNLGEALHYSNALVGLTREHGVPQFLAHGTFLSGWASSWTGDREGELRMHEGLTLLREIGNRNTELFYGALLAEVQANAGRIEEGLVTLDEQLAKGEQTGFHAEILRLRGEILLRREPLDATAAEVALLRAIEIARTQQTRAYELRTALSLARLYQALGRDLAAYELLVPALVGLTETPELPEIAAANRLLGSIAKSAREHA